MARTARRTNIQNALGDFLSPRQHAYGATLCLPVFESVGGESVQRAPTGDAFRYHAETFASRDVKSAFHVHGLLAREFPDDAITLTSPDVVLEDPHAGEVLILFGSRSNSAFPHVARRARLDRLASINFDARWTIVGQDKREFSILDPAKLSRAEYESQTDHALVARVSDPLFASTFIIAGLGGRATEGAGRFLAEKWQKLHEQAGADDFAFVLSFPPPVSPENCEISAFYKFTA